MWYKVLSYITLVSRTETILCYIGQLSTDCRLSRDRYDTPETMDRSVTKGQATLCVQSAQYRTRSSEIAFLRTVLVWLSTCIPYQLNIVSAYAITQYRTNASEIAHFVRIV